MALLTDFSDTQLHGLRYSFRNVLQMFSPIVKGTGLSFSFNPAVALLSDPTANLLLSFVGVF